MLKMCSPKGFPREHIFSLMNEQLSIFISQGQLAPQSVSGAVEDIFPSTRTFFKELSSMKFQRPIDAAHKRVAFQPLTMINRKVLGFYPANYLLMQLLV